MSELNAERLAAIAERCEKATPGPWVAYTDDSRPDVCCEKSLNAGYFGEGHLLSMDKYSPAYGQAYDNGDDAEFIAESRTDIPALLTALSQSQARVADLEAESERYRAAIVGHRAVFHEGMDRLKVENLLRDERRAISGLWEASKALWSVLSQPQAEET